MSDDTAQAADEGMSDVQLLDVRGRHGAYTASHNHVGAFDCCSAHASADDVPALLAEVERLRDLNAELSETLDVRHDETQQLRAQLAAIGETREGVGGAQADLEPAGVQYRSCGPDGWVDDLPEDNEPEWIAQYPNGWSEGYWPEQRQLYGGVWQRVVGELREVEQEAGDG